MRPTGPLPRLVRLFLFATALLWPLPLIANEAPPKVLATIKPVHALTSAVMDGIASPDLLLGSAASSPHGFTLRPSDARKLETADLIVWVGPALENFLVRALASAKTPMLALADTPGLHLLKVLEKGHSHDDGHDHGDAAFDPHIWLSPANARVMANAIASELARLDPVRAEAYRANAEALNLRLTALEEKLRHQLADVQDTPFAVYHDGYGYLIDAFDLTNVGYVTISPDRLSGAAHTRALRETLRSKQVRCLFTEPGINPARVQALADGGAIRIDELDPLGTTLSPGPHLYEQMMENIATTLVSCLTGT